MYLDLVPLTVLVDGPLASVVEVVAFWVLLVLDLFCVNKNTIQDKKEEVLKHLTNTSFPNLDYIRPSFPNLVLYIRYS